MTNYFILMGESRKVMTLINQRIKTSFDMHFILKYIIIRSRFFNKEIAFLTYPIYVLYVLSIYVCVNWYLTCNLFPIFLRTLVIDLFI